MNRRRALKWFCGLGSVALLVPILAYDGFVTAQDKAETPAEARAGSEGGEKATRTRAKPRGRLPAYFSTVVSQEQREKVYTIQSRYLKQIEDLQRQIKDLLSARDKEVDGVLSPAQLEMVNAKREAAKARRANRVKRASRAEGEG